MKNILIACLNANGVGGSELYHIELVNALSKFDINITFATLVPIQDTEVRKRINNLVTQCNISDLTSEFDLIIASQPQVMIKLLELYPTTPKIAIIHSAIRSEDPVFHPSIKHYIAVQPDIYKLLKTHISVNQIDLIYNPIDYSRFNPTVNTDMEHKYRVLFVGNWNDPLRYPSAQHLVQNCIDQDWECWFVGTTKFPSQHSNIKSFDQVYETEMFLQYVDVTAGIGGRNTIEGWLCNKPSYIYSINVDGSITNVKLIHPPKINRFKSGFVAQQHINLYKKYL